MKISELIFESIVDEGVNDQHIFKAIAMIGPMGAGKSTIAQQLVGGSGLRSLNLDNFNELLIKQGKVAGGMLTPDQLERNWELTQKQKGNSFEREVATHLSSLYNESFIRAPGSGAYVGGKNTNRMQILHEGQIRSFKGDIVPGQSFAKLNAECKSYSDFPFHQVLAGECKTLETWIDQMMAVSEKNDINVLFMKFNRKGKFVCVQSSLTWITDHFLYFTSKTHKDWLIIEYENFFRLNKELLKSYCANITETNSTSKIINIETQQVILPTSMS